MRPDLIPTDKTVASGDKAAETGRKNKKDGASACLCSHVQVGDFTQHYRDLSGVDVWFQEAVRPKDSPRNSGLGQQSDS